MEMIDLKKATELVKGADRLPREEIEALARERLAFLIAYAKKHSPYLREKYANVPENPKLADIPIATRAEMVEHFDEWMCDSDITKSAVSQYAADLENIFTPFLGKYTLITTSGTTAAPLFIIRDERHRAVHGALMDQRYFHGPLLASVPGVDDPDMKICGIVTGSGFFSSYTSFQKTRRAYEQRGMGDRVQEISLFSSTENMVKELNEFQPDIIGCYPSIIQTLAHEQKAGRLHIQPRYIGCSAEKLFEENRRFISEAFGCPVNDNYCSSEGGEVAMLCPKGHLHLNSDWVLLEPVDEDMNPVPPGTQSSGVLMTNLACLVQPVIRYYMSDRVVLYDTPCGCGLNTPYIDIEGRTDDLLEFEHGGKRIRVSCFQLSIPADYKTPGCKKCQFIQRSNEEIELRMTTMENYDRRSVMEEVAKNVHAALCGMGLGHVRLTQVDQPMLRTKGGKLRTAFKDFRKN